MNAQQILRTTLDTSMMVVTSYVNDLSDAELMTRPGTGCNHLAWQLGHLLSSQCSLLEMVQPGSSISLPEGFVEKHAKDRIGENDPAKFSTKQEYLDLFEKVNAATVAALEKTTEADFDQPGPESWRSMFPTMGNVWVLIATHPMMHVGQFVPVRRMLDKPVVI